MEVKLNGGGPAIRFRIGIVAVVQVVVAAATFLAAMKMTQSDINRLQENQKRLEAKVDEMLNSRRRTEALIETLLDEIRYYREKLDRHIEKGVRNP